MIRKKLLILATLSLIVAVFQNCSKKDSNSGGGGVTSYYDNLVTSVLNLPNTPLNYVITYPAHIANALAATDNTPAGNGITNDGATLGRVLFYDKNLSKNKTVSCASCHQQRFSFDDTAVKSRGFENGLTRRHSMPLLNVRFYQSGKMFWDERAATLEIQTLMPIQDATEMGLTLQGLVDSVKAKSYYPQLFQKAFGTTEINSDRISRALSQFVRSIVTYQSKYDRVKQGLATFTTAEAAGENVFTTAPPPPPGGGPAPVSCAGCHAPPMFITSSPAAPFALLDATDQGINNQNRFKSGSLRNVTQTAPYFHNGSVASLSDMFANVPAHRVPPGAVANITAFLQTLNDNTITTDVKFSNPFR